MMIEVGGLLRLCQADIVTREQRLEGGGARGYVPTPVRPDTVVVGTFLVVSFFVSTKFVQARPDVDRDGISKDEGLFHTKFYRV